MQPPKKFLRDKLMLLLLSSNIFLAFVCIVLVFLRLNIGQGTDGYILQYRSNLGISAFTTGGIVGMLSFALFALALVVLNTALSIRTYKVRRELSIAVLASGVLLLVLAIIVSNALLVLH
ncbi:MAG TPA: hypothetical protein VMR45_05960 [Patescibacteria group bacterium]|nr:hypothetical protein [Patescibacteria group bacterium]